MMFKNSFKLLLANFSSVWKLLLYKIIVVAVVFGLFMLATPALSNLLNVEQLSDSVATFLANFGFGISYIDLLTYLYTILQTVINVLSEMIATSPLLFLYLVFLLFILLPFLWHFSDVAIGECAYGFMASQTKYGFMGAMIRKLGVSVSYSILLTLAILPFTALMLAGGVAVLYLTVYGGLLLYFLPFILFVYLLLINSLKITMLSGWTPSIVVFNCNAVTGFNKGMTALFRRFLKVWSTSIILTFIVLSVAMLIGCYALLIIIPIASLFISIFGMVMFFGSQGMRYYVDMDTIITPKKLEQTDKICKLKYVI